jgi:hypothetical protein
LGTHFPENLSEGRKALLKGKASQKQQWHTSMTNEQIFKPKDANSAAPNFWPGSHKPYSDISV